MNIIQGDALQVFRTINNIPTDTTLVEAWLTLKRNIGDADGAAALQKNITTRNVAGTGQIENDGDGAVKGRVRFDITPANSLSLTPGIDYYYDIQVRTTDPGGGLIIFTGERGLWSVDQQVTIDA